MPQLHPIPTAQTASPIRAMIVDHAVVVRGVISRWVGNEADMQVVRVCKNGREAVEQAAMADPDVVVLDIEMPDLDGISTLRELLKQKPDIAVIMASALTRR